MASVVAGRMPMVGQKEAADLAQIIAQSARHRLQVGSGGGHYSLLHLGCLIHVDAR